MKFFMAIFLLSTSLSTLAQERDPNYCHGDDVCETGKFNPFKQNVLYARGYGRTRMRAVTDSEKVFDKHHGKIKGPCGIYSGPYSMGTTDLGDGTYSAWTICPVGGSTVRSAPSPRCAMIFGIITCK